MTNKIFEWVFNYFEETAFMAAQELLDKIIDDPEFFKLDMQTRFWVLAAWRSLFKGDTTGAGYSLDTIKELLILNS